MAQDEFFSRLGGRFPPHGVPFLEPGPPPAPGQARRLALVLAYDGQAYAGWQVQPGAPTVQGQVEAALRRLCGHPVRILASGRTDAGVHALGQVASFDTLSRLDPETMARGLGALLPSDIHLRALGVVAGDFHARYSAQAKTYDYYLWPACGPSLFLRGRLWAHERPLDQVAVRQALACLPGPQDLQALASQGSEVQGTTVREILEANLETWPWGLWRVRVTATGFLRHVVRNLVGVLAQVGAGRLGPQDLAGMLASGQRRQAGPKAPPGGLYLSRVYYRPWPGDGQGPEIRKV
ncbi:MAG: tRNA pseudouridine(38-40) synthase TruA [Desulfarculus sp.]|nr:tRNA pseudouridine(38-40) synthase TruA [Desulfarculus sp.]